MIFSKIIKFFIPRINPWERIFSKEVPADLLFPYKKFSKICDFIQQFKSETVLDVAMGNGRHTIELISRGLDVYGFDLSSSAISLAKKNISAKFPDYDLSKIVLSDMFCDFPYEDNKFDCVVAIQAIYHGFKEDMQKSFFEIARVLKSNGVFIFTLSKDNKRSTVVSNFLDKRRNLIIKIGNMTYFPISGRERGLVHYYPSKFIIKRMLDKYFSHVTIEDDTESNYFLVKCIKKDNL